MDVDLGLVRRLEGANAHRATGAVKGLGGVTIEVAGGVLVLCGPGSYINAAVAIGLYGPIAADDFATIEDAGAAMGVTPSIDVSPWADASLLEGAGARGYVLTSHLTLLARPVANAGPSPTHVVITEVIDDAGFATWQDLSARGFGHGEPEARAINDAFTAAVRTAPGVRLFTASLDGAPAGVASLTVHEGVAEFGGMATLPTARGRGVQSALIAHRLAVARELGCDLAGTSANPGGQSERNLRRAGFEVIYTRSSVRPRQSR